MSYDQKQKIFKLFYKRYFKKIVSYCMRKLHNQRYVAEDIAQEAFLRAYDNLDKIYRRSEFLKWVYTVARNLSYNYTRDNKRNLSLTGNWMQDGQDDSRGKRFDEILSSSDSSPYKAAEKNELLTILSNCLERLSSDYRAAVELCCMEGFSYKRAAVVLNANENIIAHDLMRAKRKLYKMAGF